MFLLAFAGFVLPHQRSLLMWDYKTIKISTEFGFFSGTQFDEDTLESELKKLGRDGWELVSIFGVEKVKGGSKYVIAVLKKRLD